MPDNEFGYTKWGMDWVRLAEPIRQTRPEPLLPRARSVARNHGVQATIEGRVVRATIHRGGEASVIHLEVAPLTRAAITAIGEVLPDTTVLTDEMHRAVVDAGCTVAPVLAGTDCSCKARSARCLHVLAAFYDMARRVDENPRLALEIQGYFQAAQDDSPAPVEVPRWVPINTFDPANYFGELAPT
ncbi:SWIM zinc finger family protein [Nocardia sp. XZ_19_369]|uniref:SWIM zinc finger family protein n=1 Tax=Nocardia sp. XZ_19_369 TaxID=2769487 RepID=UPI00188E3603|nr:SWIM zinc finger family protein [Nocardia sp. XZ_19_369]